MRLDGTRAIVTGGGRGIGRACALELARQGADVAVNDRPGSPDLAGTVAEIHALGQRACGIEADAFTRAGCETILAEAIGQLGRVDILICNASKVHRAPFLEYDPDTVQEVLNATLTAGFHLSQLTARHMVATGGGGKIVFISSVHGVIAFRNSVAYDSGKAGLLQLSKCLALELAPHRINVNAVIPGWIDTPGERLVFSDDQLHAGAAQIPIQRLGRPEEIAKAAAFLASEDAEYVTSAELRVDGAFVYRHN